MREESAEIIKTCILCTCVSNKQIFKHEWTDISERSACERSELLRQRLGEEKILTTATFDILKILLYDAYQQFRENCKWLPTSGARENK